MGDLAFLHRFKQGRLRSRGRSIQFIRQQHLAENRPLAHHELIGLTIEDLRSRDIRR